MDLALGEAGLDREIVLRSTWGDLWRMIHGHWIRQDREWDRTRTVLAMLYNTHRGKRQKAITPQRILPLAIDRIGRGKAVWTEKKYKKFEKAQKAWGLIKTEDGTE